MEKEKIKVLVSQAVKKEIISEEEMEKILSYKLVRGNFPMGYWRPNEKES